MRKHLRPQFSRDQAANLELEEDHVQELIQHLPTDELGWTMSINIIPIFYRLTIDSATEFVFGISVHSQSLQSGDQQFEWKNLAASFDIGTKMLGDRTQLQDLCWLYNP